MIFAADGCFASRGASDTRRHAAGDAALAGRTCAMPRTSLLYAALIVLPLSGYLGSAFSGYPVRYFGMTLPAWAPKSAAVKDR